MLDPRNGILRFPFSILHLNGDGVLSDSESRFAFAIDCGSLAVRDADGRTLFSNVTAANHFSLRLKPAKGQLNDGWKLESVDALGTRKKRGETCHEWYEDVNARGDTLGDECGS